MYCFIHSIKEGLKKNKGSARDLTGEPQIYVQSVGDALLLLLLLSFDSYSPFIRILNESRARIRCGVLDLYYNFILNSLLLHRLLAASISDDNIVHISLTAATRSKRHSRPSAIMVPFQPTIVCAVRESPPSS